MLVCLYVFNTLIELEHVSDIADAENPIKNREFTNRGLEPTIFDFETTSGQDFLRRSDLKQPQLPETRLKIDFDRFFQFLPVKNFI